MIFWKTMLHPTLFIHLWTECKPRLILTIDALRSVNSKRFSSFRSRLNIEMMILFQYKSEKNQSGVSNHLTLMKWVWLVQVVVTGYGYERWAWDPASMLGRTSPPPILPSEFPCSVSHSLSLCGRQPAPGPALPNSGRANQPRASALAPFPVSACRLLALSEGQLSAVRPTLPPTNNHKEPSVLGGRGEVRRNRRSIHKNTLPSVCLYAAYRELGSAFSD